MYYVLDTESASLSSGVVELAWLRVDSQLNIVEEFVSRCHPQRKIDAGAYAVHGISRIMLHHPHSELANTCLNR
jgi:DNA polymerase III epsilon subunit-like protein